MLVLLKKIFYSPPHSTPPRLYPRHASAMNNLGTLTRSSEEAERFYRRALDINPQHNRALFNLGNLLKYVRQTHTSTHWRQSLNNSCEMNFIFSKSFLNGK